MKYWIICIFASASLFAQSAATVAAASSGGSAVFPIDPMVRGADLIKMFTVLNSAPYKTNNSRIAIQTTRNPALNGFIPNIQTITPATNHTLLLVSYYPQQNTTRLNYVVVFVEQIMEMVYSTNMINGPFSSSITSGILPFYSVNLLQRAQDIINIIATLNGSPYNTNISAIGIQTTLSGPFYGPITNGFIPNVQSISPLATTSPNGTLLLIQYKSPATSATSQSIVVGTDQIYAIAYSSGF